MVAFHEKAARSFSEIAPGLTGGDFKTLYCVDQA
jgi:hypothetical protein